MNGFYMEYTEILQKMLRPFGRNLLYLLMSLPLGIIYFTFAVTTISLGLGLSITIVGIPIIFITLIYTNKIVEYEKIIAAKILNTNTNTNTNTATVTRIVDLSKNEGMIKRMIGVIKDSKNWRSTLYCIIKLPISIMHFTVATCLTVLSIGCVCQPINFIITKKSGIDIYKNNITVGDLLGIQLPNSVESILYFIVGIGIAFITIKIINNLAERWAEFTLKF